MATPLPAADAARLASASFTYDAVGGTRADPPAGYHHLEHVRSVGGRTFEEAVELLLTWQLHLRAGLQVAAARDRVEDGDDVLLRLGLGRVSLRIPCRVVYVIDEAERCGFAYGTLRGHPEEGEELFLLERRADGGADLRVRAFSRPATLLARAGGPATRWAQGWMTQRYLRALDG